MILYSCTKPKCSYPVMASLQDLCLNTIENTGTSVQKLFKDVPVPKSITHRHPLLKIIARNSFDPSNDGYYIFENAYEFVILTTITIEFDGVYTVSWSREIHSLDGVSCELDALQETEKFKEIMKAMSRFFSKCHPDFVGWSAMLEFDLEDSALLEVEKLIKGCDALFSSMIGPTGDEIMDLQEYFSFVDAPNPCSEHISELKSALGALRKLSVCY